MACILPPSLGALTTYLSALVKTVSKKFDILCEVIHSSKVMIGRVARFRLAENHADIRAMNSDFRFARTRCVFVRVSRSCPSIVSLYLNNYV
jgi:hypothetical protein